jgi:hypothetical protein
MAKIEDYKAYWLDLAAKAGVPADKAQAMADQMGDESVARALKQGFKAIPDYSHDLDDVRDRTKAEAISEAKAFYDNWYKTTGEPAYLEHQKVANDYKRYKDLYGDLDGTGGSNGTNGSRPTKEEIESLINDRLAARDQAYAGLTKTAMTLSVRHFKEYNEVLDPDDLEQFANKNKFSDLKTAYDAYVRPKAEARQAADIDAKIKAAKEEGAREALSRHKLPTDSKPREYTNPFQSKEVVPKDVDPDSFSRDSFLEAWNKPNQ